MPSTKKPETNVPLGRARAFDTSFFVLAAICAGAALAVAWLQGPGRVVEIAVRYLGFLALLMPKILCGFFVAAAVPLLIPRETLSHWVGRESGLRGLVVSSLAGGLIPGGPMMVFPLALGFRASGASTAVIIAFVSAWCLYSLNRTLIWEMSFLSVDVVLLRILICLPFPILAGFLASKVMR
ncbi:MAG: hypothetical protein AAF748_02130 [Pseudomonadota bacterium]